MSVIISHISEGSGDTLGSSSGPAAPKVFNEATETDLSVTELSYAMIRELKFRSNAAVLVSDYVPHSNVNTETVVAVYRHKVLMCFISLWLCYNSYRVVGEIYPYLSGLLR